MRTLVLPLVFALAACAGHRGQLNSGMPSVHVADAALAGGAPAMALHVAQDILAKRPRDVPALLRQGDALFAMERNGEAADSYSLALAVQPDSIPARIGLGRTRLITDPSKAEATFLEVVNGGHQSAAAQNDLGIARDLQGRHAAAQQAYQAALGTAPDLIAAQVNLGLSLALAGDTRRALEILRPLAVNRNATSRIRQDLAAALALAGDSDEAARVLRIDLPQEQVADALSGYQQLRLLSVSQTD